MSSKYPRTVPAAFGEESRFSLEPEYLEADRAEVEREFNELRERLLADLLDDTKTIALQKRFRQVSGEAAGLAWNTGYPLLVFPTLFEELTSKARQTASRQQKVTARSEMLLAESV